MKYMLLAVVPVVFFMNCSSGPGNEKKDSSGKDSAAVNIDPAKPHPVRNGKADYAFRPDTNINSLILGSADSFRVFKKKNGFTGIGLGGNRYGAVYVNNRYKDNHPEPNEYFEVRITQDKNDREIPYSFILQSIDMNAHAPKLCTERSLQGEDFNYVSGFSIYPGMSYQDVIAVYHNQELMEWEKGDTVYLQYKPKPKDYNFYRRFRPEKYSVTFKFFDDVLRRIEYYVDPAEFEK
jgi:hypothetical protein